VSLWKVQTSRRFDREVSKLDRTTAGRILDYLEELELLDNPRSRGKGLTGDQAGWWRYRVGNYRILVEIHDHELIVLAIGVGHRSRIYRD
jgi:mRNA interferase RelE/StbE